MVKFSQKLGFKGYPDLKYSVGEAIARADNGDAAQVAAAAAAAIAGGASAGSLWRRKSEAEEETRLINPPETIDAIARCDRRGAGKVFIIGLGEDSIRAQAFALKLSLLGILTVHNVDSADDRGHLGRRRERRAAGVLRARQAAGAVPDLPLVPRAARQSDHGDPPHLESAARSRGHLAVRIGA